MQFTIHRLLTGNVSKKITTTLASIITLVGLSIQPVQSALTDKGPIHPINKFPSWVSDANGNALQLCLDGNGAGICTFTPVIAGNAISEATGFGIEAFWWNASATLNLVGGRKALLVQSLQATYLPATPAATTQFAFGRIRMRVDIPVAGHYKIWHPSLNESNGCQPEEFTANAGTRAINVTRDIGGGTPFDNILKGEVGPFLVWDPNILPAAPTGYVGDPNVNHEIIGGHCGINYFRIEGPAGVDLDGLGNNFVQTSQFSVQGKIYDPANIPPSIEPVRATYFRTTNASTGNTTARINVWVKAPPTASVTINDLPQANQNGDMTYDGNSTFFKRALLNATYGLHIPTQVTVVATSDNGMFSTQAVNIIDQVSIQSVSWAAAAQTLKVVALSSDKISVSSGIAPELTLNVGINAFPMTQSGAAGRYELTLTGITVPPARVTVTSTKGGSDSEEIPD